MQAFVLKERKKRKKKDKKRKKKDSEKQCGVQQKVLFLAVGTGGLDLLVVGNKRCFQMYTDRLNGMLLTWQAGDPEISLLVPFSTM